MTPLARAGQWFTRLLAAIGLTVVLATATPIDRWWAHAYSGPIEQPKRRHSHPAQRRSRRPWTHLLLVLLARPLCPARLANRRLPEDRDQRRRRSGILDFLVVEGVPREDIVAEWQSESTRENGINTARLVAGMPGKKVLLTSDFHMYRAIRVFRKLGVDVTPMPVPDVLKSAKHWNARFPAFETLVVEIHQDRLLPPTRLDLTPG